MARAATDRAALAARFSSSPEHERPTAATAARNQIRNVTFTVKLPAGRHHELTELLGDIAFQLGVAPKWVGLQAAYEELAGLILTDTTVADRLRQRLAQRVRDL
jgi:hypothetical protein